MPPSLSPTRLVVVLPCCIGDVVMATAALTALRRAFPTTHIAWVIGRWSRPVLEQHPHIDALIDAGESALPAFPGDVWRLAGRIRQHRPDALLSFVRSPRISAVAVLSGARVRAGLNSGGRGFGYTIRVPVDPLAARHEAALYLDTSAALITHYGGAQAAASAVQSARTFVPVQDADRDAVWIRLDAQGIQPGQPYLVVHAGGGRNPGMVMDSKRYPPAAMGRLTARLAAHQRAAIVVIGGEDDGERAQAVRAAVIAAGLPPGHVSVHAGAFTFGQIGALAAAATLYLGNDTGLTHYAAAAGGRVVMLLGPTDPARYAPYSDHALAVWKPTDRTGQGGVRDAAAGWDWARDGIDPDDAEAQIVHWLAARQN